MKKSDVDEVVLVGGSTRVPKVKNMLKKFFKIKVLQDGINPDEAVAWGAAIQASILAGDTGERLVGVSLRDVTPLSLGIETLGGIMLKIIPRNSSVPALG